MSVVGEMATDNNGQILVNRKSGSTYSLIARHFDNDENDEHGDNEDDGRCERGQSEREDLLEHGFSDEDNEEKEEGEEEDEEEENDGKEDDNDVVVPDGGWGWVVCFGSFMVNFILDGTFFSFGILLLDLLDDLGQSKGTTSWAGSALLGFSMIMGPAVSALLRRYSIRQVTIAGSILALVSFVVSVFSPNVYVLIFTYGVVGGCGFSMVFLPAIIVVGLYFNKKRAIATGIATSGSGLGTFAYAHITDGLLKTFHWRGTILILAGLVFNCAVCGMLFRPLLNAGTNKKSKKNSRAADATVKSNKIRGEDDSSASSGYSSDHILPDSPKKPTENEEGKGKVPANVQGCSDSSTLSCDDPTSKSTTDTLGTLSISSSILDDKKQHQPPAISMTMPAPQSKSFCHKCHQKRQSLCDFDISTSSQKHPDGENPATTPSRSVSQYLLSNHQCSCAHTVIPNGAERSSSQEGRQNSHHQLLENEANVRAGLPEIVDMRRSSVISAASSCKGDMSPEGPHTNALPRHKFPRDNTSSSLLHEAIMNRLASREGISEMAESSRFSTGLRQREADSLCELREQSHDNHGVKITISSANDNNNTSSTYEHSDRKALGRCSGSHDSLQQQQPQQPSEHDLKGKDISYVKSRENCPISVLLNSQPVVCEYTPGNTNTPFGRPYQSADHLHHLAKGSNPLYYNANELSHLVDTRMLTSEYHLHGLHSRVMGHKRQHVKGHSSTHFHPFGTDPIRSSSHHDQISKGLLKPMLRKDIYYGGSVNHLPDFKRCGSVTSFMAAMTRSSSQEEVDVIPLEDETSVDCCPKAVKGLLPWYLFKDSIFILLLVTFTSWTAQSVTLTYLPDLAVSLGIPRSDAAFLISVVGISNILGRVVAGFVTDCLRISSIWLYCLALTLASGVNVTLALGSSYGLLCICCAIFGLCMGVAVSMRTIVLAEQLGIEVLTQSFGVVALFQGIAFTVNPPIAGKLIDDLHSFKPPFLMAAVLYGISGISCIGVTILGRWRRRRRPPLSFEGDEISLKSQSFMNSLTSVQPSHV